MEPSHAFSSSTFLHAFFVLCLSCGDFDENIMKQLYFSHRKINLFLFFNIVKNVDKNLQVLLQKKLQHNSFFTETLYKLWQVDVFHVRCRNVPFKMVQS